MEGVVREVIAEYVPETPEPPDLSDEEMERMQQGLFGTRLGLEAAAVEHFSAAVRALRHDHGDPQAIAVYRDKLAWAMVDADLAATKRARRFANSRRWPERRDDVQRQSPV
jgi:MoxR-like ATPase